MDGPVFGYERKDESSNQSCPALERRPLPQIMVITIVMMRGFGMANCLLFG
jgi:hypothetical protein